MAHAGHHTERTGETTTAVFVEDALTRYEGRLLGYALRLSNGDQERAADLVQDCFLRLCRAKPSDVEGGLVAWLWTVCRNRSHELYRKERRMTSLTSASDPLTSPADADEVSALTLAERGDQVDAALVEVHRLPDRQQELLRLRLVDGLRYKEIATVTGLSTSNVGYLLHTALSTLRRRLTAAEATRRDAAARAANTTGGSR